jgi:hypothetical protein
MKSGVLLLALLAGCASGRNSPGGDDDDVDASAVDAADGDGPIIDGAEVDAPSPPIDAPIDAPAGTAVAPLLLTELSLAPNGGEMIEILNPTGVTVDLRDYYLTDVPTYFRMPAAAHTVDASDFIARFPVGATLGPGAVITVALDTAANFTAATTAIPTYSIAGATMNVVAVSGTATLTNGGEPVILFHWNGASDRVTDVDIMIAGAPSVGNALINKSGVIVDGPDPDTVGTAYAVDAFTIGNQGSTPGSGLSTKRLALESAATEIQSGGNGPGGQDETSEQTATTWDAAAFTALTPGTVPPALQP